MADGDRVAAITGGARGIGRACARRLGAEGYRLALLDVEQELLEQTVNGLLEEGATAIGLVADVVDEDAISVARDAVLSRFGRVDVLVNNAGRGVAVPTLEMSLEQWRGVLDGCLTATFLCSRAFAEPMRSQGAGAIVNLSSIMGYTFLPTRAAYAAAKAAIVAFTKVTACEWAEHGIRVNAVAPGYVETEAIRMAIDAGIQEPEGIVGRTPARRLGRPEEVAAAVAYLVSDDAGFVTGHVLVIDGGYSSYGAWWRSGEPTPGVH